MFRLSCMYDQKSAGEVERNSELYKLCFLVTGGHSFSIRIMIPVECRRNTGTLRRRPPPKSFLSSHKPTCIETA